MNGRIVRIVIGFVIQRPANPQVTVAISQVNLPQYSEQLAAIGVKNVISNTDPVFFVGGSERHQFNAFVTQRMNDAIKSAGPKAIRIKVPSGIFLLKNIYLWAADENTLQRRRFNRLTQVDEGGFMGREVRPTLD